MSLQIIYLSANEICPFSLNFRKNLFPTCFSVQVIKRCVHVIPSPHIAFVQTKPTTKQQNLLFQEIFISWNQFYIYMLELPLSPFFFLFLFAPERLSSFLWARQVRERERINHREVWFGLHLIWSCQFSTDPRISWVNPLELLHRRLTLIYPT